MSLDVERPKHEPARVHQLFEHPFAVHLRGVTVRQILDSLAKQQGAMCWVAEYKNPAGAYQGLRLSFVGFDHWAASAEAR
jgi:hypothetical protein